ncbi:MAG: hypothetical protein UT32_C0011G0022 [Parcubacteria group bacterium GW2011_GWC2_39_14]|nr:MAG: hypothetical protein UT32_C0011G0022 [Parcubacteria group bacterium GW2011_GWC2_39_14]KKR55058.1 MAG: hypothetical protein UT91_C0005G0059 [Parcubacteria group bacterium GW2011_GWA2_40_23]
MIDKITKNEIITPKIKTMIKLTVYTKKIGPILRGHPWVYSGAIIDLPEGLSYGEPVSLYSSDDEFLAQGFFNSYSQLAVRIWGYEENEEVNDDFFVKRIELALSVRLQAIDQKKTNCYRIVNSENDFLPGLIVDKYADYLVVQFHNRGIEAWQEQIINALIDIVKPKGIYDKTYKRSLTEEETDNRSRLLFGKVPATIKVKENGLLFDVDVVEGQKTGFFLDQRDKRQALTKYVKDKNVLNCFSYTGGFSVYALAAGAKHVTSVDVSPKAIELAEKNFILNDFPKTKYTSICEDVKKYLRTIEPNTFDVIVLDPPAFIKDRDKIKEGMIGYKSINEVAMRIMPSNSILMTCSCSAHLSLDDFKNILVNASINAGKTIQILEVLTFAPDHLELPSFTEGGYLKVLILRVL